MKGNHALRDVTSHGSCGSASQRDRRAPRPEQRRQRVVRSGDRLRPGRQPGGVVDAIGVLGAPGGRSGSGPNIAFLARTVGRGHRSMPEVVRPQNSPGSSSSDRIGASLWWPRTQGPEKGTRGGTKSVSVRVPACVRGGRVRLRERADAYDQSRRSHDEESRRSAAHTALPSATCVPVTWSSRQDRVHAVRVR